MYRDFKLNYVKTLSLEGFELLNDYEFPWYLVNYEDENNLCMTPYDVGDGVLTFGPGLTYPNEKSGLEDINELFNTNYTTSNDCISIDILFTLQKEKMIIYEKYVYKFLYKHRLKLNQNEFDGLVLLAYNSPDFLKNEEVIDMLTSYPSQNEYIKAINNYYKTLNNYFDNLNTDEENDGYGEGWYNRIVDSSEVYFNAEYEFQNSATNY